MRYFNYEYDFNEGQCKESVKEQRERCDPRDYEQRKGRYEGEVDDRYERRASDKFYRGGRRYRGRAAQAEANKDIDFES